MAIRLRLASFGSDTGDLVLPIKDGETLRHAAVRILGQVQLNKSISDTFNFLVDGEFVDPNEWERITLKADSDVIIVPKLGGGDANNIIRTAIIIAATVYTSGAAAAYFGGYGVASALATAAVTTAVSALAYSAFPPPPVDLGLSDTGASLSKSQMYAISGQSNQIKKFDIVPKVYGTHRMFPIIAATPYTELSTENGVVVQDYYAIYDFGLGPVYVTDLKIGDTPLDNFSNYEINFVDLHKPATDDGFWDGKLENKFRIYRGDVSGENLAIVLDKDQSDSNVQLYEYQTVRNTAQNPDGVDTEVTLNFVCPQGLQSINTSGTTGHVNIDLKIRYAKVGTDNWKYYNDLSEVKSFSANGGTERTQDTACSLYINSSQISSGYLVPIRTTTSTIGFGTGLGIAYKFITTYYGRPEGANSFIGSSIDYAVGQDVFISGKYCGKVTAKYTVDAFNSEYVLSQPLTVRPELLKYTVSYPLNNPSSVSYTYENIFVSTVFRKVFLGNFRVGGNDNSPIYASLKFSPKEAGQYKVEITRENTFTDYTYQILDSLALVGINTRFDRTPIVTDKRHTFLELRIRATNQLSGSIQNLSGLAISVLDVYDTNIQQWVKLPTSNPAWVFADILTGSINKRPIPKSRLHLPSLLEWAQYCDEIPPTDPGIVPYFTPRFSCNMVMDYVTTVQSLVAQVTSAAQASMNIVDGKYGVLIDKLKTVPVQVFTPRNSNNFNSSKIFSIKPNALKVKYIDPDNNWQISELAVYDDGFNAETAETFEEVTTFACTDADQAFRFGRFIMAQNRLRQEVITIDVDFENLVCTRGDYVKITQDSMKVGGNPARVKTIAGSTITIDDAIETNPLLSYGYTFRSALNGIVTGTLTVVNSDTFTLSGLVLPEVGDLIIIGEVGKITYDCIVKAITPNGEYGATLTLIEKADAIYDSEKGGPIPDYDAGISTTIASEFIPPSEVKDLAVVDNLWECDGAGYKYTMVLDWEVPDGAAYDIFEVYVDFGKGFDLAGTTKSSLFEYIVSEINLNKEHRFKVLAVSATGRKLDLGLVGQVAATPARKTTRPSNVETLNIDITGEVLQLFWPAIPDCDTLEYLIRYSPVTTDNWASSVPLMRVDRRTTLAATQARTGIYLIKAVDFNGNESLDAASAITTIPNLFNLNIIEETTDFPALPGPKENVIYDGSGLILDTFVDEGLGTFQFYHEGYYYYNNFIDLGDIYTCRIQSLIRAEGYSYDDIIGNWITLSEVETMANVLTSEWDVETQYRTTESLNVMSEWVTLSDIDPISEGTQDIWTPWRKFVIGDATGRILQFRLKLISNLPTSSPRVFDGKIRVDMPDRTESYNNLTATTSGYSVTYDPAFKGPSPSPAIQISIDDAESGDYWEFTTKDLNGFTVKFYDKNNNPVGRTFDAMAKGYGRKHGEII